MAERFRRIFPGPLPVIAMAHVPALPGSPLYDARFRRPGRDRRRSARPRDPRRARASTPSCSATRTTGRTCSRRHRCTSPRWRASSASWRPRSARSASTTCGTPAPRSASRRACGAAFMREVLPGVYESDMGLWETDAGGLLRERRAYGGRRAVRAHERHARVRIATREPHARPSARARPSSRRSPMRSSCPGAMAGAEPALDVVREVAEAVAGSAPVAAQHGRQGGQHRRLRAVRRRRHRRQRPQARRRHLEPGRARARAALPGRRSQRLSRAVLLGLDLGTTAVKAVVLDPERGLLAADSLPNAPGLAPTRLVGAGRGRLARQRARADTARRAPLPASTRPRSSPSAWPAACPASLPLDEHDRPLRPALLYNDARAHAEIDELTAELARRARAAAHGRRHHAAVGRPQAALAAAARARRVGAHAPHRRLVRLACRATRRGRLQRAQLGARKRPLRPGHGRLRARSLRGGGRRPASSSARSATPPTSSAA